ncbi:beta-1,4-glucuronyltransferase 1 [Zeugodacus cucurbitae]|nr:beta-1,4-glucuronyltransferase 1 [Zeugodacus cucurbitae]XP_054082984.1 beta-1,4-glucuronyltransferase 1 [Zeugodacus cucurbitae]XP_054082985.1 beta-1,4-glucuronyltransferase 1 [Zeugodacus cucurbitae]XP_054082986.1 beta-1,4-glucuronyltransferase 1 [Zeugodacus cucurbitae]XP_054082987.1 beta-1,4-glucuronyltransferase 1 [Zeugodacus cucurbitae]XP_054082988.1 beta-1,4-glucuronyltransferase 1 [Zeugodacus cucurbitae]XP_054082989.1 beta-1,4-glucuronyltransferase 1 [Zeugodacus cucurbitae]XP_05408299
MVRFEPLGQKMFTRRNWLLRCSILINILVILYICSHVMIGNGTGFNGSNTFFIQERGVEPANSAQLIGDKIQPPPPPPPASNDLPPAPVAPNDTGGAEAAPVASNDAVAAPSQNLAGSAVAGNIAGAANLPEAVVYTNGTSNDGDAAVAEDKDPDVRLDALLNCYDRDFQPDVAQRGDFWVLTNYVRADHGPIKCSESITYTTHADYTFLDNLIPLLERWNAPVSIAMHTPGTDYQPTIDAIKYLRECLPESHLVRTFTTFHLYFSTKHIPKTVAKSSEVLKTPYNCTLPPPYFNVSSGHLYKSQKKLLYPVNVGRNIARDAALTHFILASDIELYPNPGLVKKFLEMIARNDAYLQRKAPRVFPLSIFEVEANATVPRDKSELQDYLRTGKAIPFHKRVCASCHGVPQSKEWMAANETDELSVFHIGKRTGYFRHWEPIYIGTHADPHYDERLSWEGKSDKMTQGYALCVLDYEFHILDNAFLVHKPGIKVLQKDNRRAMLAGKTNQLIRKIIYPELKIMYGVRQGCVV